jgi:hypothetical protein
MIRMILWVTSRTGTRKPVRLLWAINIPAGGNVGPQARRRDQSNLREGAMTVASPTKTFLPFTAQ